MNECHFFYSTVCELNRSKFAKCFPAKWKTSGWVGWVKSDRQLKVFYVNCISTDHVKIFTESAQTWSNDESNKNQRLNPGHWQWIEILDDDEIVRSRWTEECRPPNQWTKWVGRTRRRQINKTLNIRMKTLAFVLDEIFYAKDTSGLQQSPMNYWLDPLLYAKSCLTSRRIQFINIDVYRIMFRRNVKLASSS